MLNLSSRFSSVVCAVRRLFRRHSWAYLFVIGLASYPVQYYWQVRHAASQGTNARDAADLAAATASKMVDPTQVFSKMSIAVGVFCLINLLAWFAHNLATPVGPDWAKGDYRTSKNGYPATPGYKGTFLALGHKERLDAYNRERLFQIIAAGISVWAAFMIQ
ncbi:hypothetical protein SAMN06265337_1926 [Hymenobacter gelipurpurascens]|uniref:Uncharacterized protein n=1 Tax=Hymenobacter gelipurpurascens TaxID=89968 RepID=A0A212TMT7_9BACT|nr:hypothetical protein [Hymenobacter gelipurpurascens]SNC67367.1 hypothetical protein SAMN06265337_1926 [Hymenobacter gelipurpurascens]